MKIEHVAIWSRDIERMKNFYQKYFDAISNDKYTNKKKGFQSYFLSFNTGARLEIMNRKNITDNLNSTIDEYLGIIHLAISVGSAAVVEALTERLRSDGYTIIGEPRRTGDGYYESCILDPDGNRIEITE